MLLSIVLGLGILSDLGCSGIGRNVPTEILTQANQDARADKQRRLLSPVESTRRGDGFEISSQQQWGMRETAADALARIGQPAVATLRAALRDPDLQLRLQACNILARIGPLAADAAPDLTTIVADGNQPLELRKSAALALGQIGPPAAGAIPVLVNALRDDAQ